MIEAQYQSVEVRVIVEYCTFFCHFQQSLAAIPTRAKFVDIICAVFFKLPVPVFKMKSVSQAIQLDGVTIQSSSTGKVLGLYLDTRLCWKPHITSTETRMKMQIYPLSRLTGLTWGIDINTSRRVYMTVIRSALAYAALIWHKASEKLAESPRRQAKKLNGIQNSCLRTVLGVFKATPIRQLKTEAFTPPLDP